MNSSPPRTNSAPSQMTSILASASLYSPNPLAPALYHQFPKADQSRQPAGSSRGRAQHFRSRTKRGEIRQRGDFALASRHDCAGVAFYWRADRAHRLDRLQGAEAEKAVSYLALRRTIRAVRIEINDEAAPHGRPT